MAAPSSWTLYDLFKLALAQGKIAWNADSFKIALFTSASIVGSHSVSPATYTAFNADGHELPTANGYTVGGVSLGVGSLSNASGAIHFSMGNASWAITGAGITARFAVIYDDTVSGKPAIAYFILDSTPADYVVPAGKTFSIVISDILVAT